jgi:hypothetical protein
MTRHDWASFNAVRKIILKEGGIIFGGAVRDLIYHNFQASEFYKEQDAYLKKNPTQDISTTFMYEDTNASPTTLGRFLVPSDIDVIIYEDMYETLISKIQKKYPIKIKCIKDLQYLITDIEPNVYKLYTIEVYCVSQRNLTHYYVSIVKLDLIICPNDRTKSIPLKEVDFNVNALFQSADRDIYVCPAFERMNENRSFILFNIMNDIKSHMARATSCNITHYRIDKLINKGWKVLFKYKIYNFHTTQNIEQGETCIICTANKSEFEECVNFKKCACKSIICMPCMLSNYAKLDKCPTCRIKLIYNEADVEFRKNELSLYNNYTNIDL